MLLNIYFYFFINIDINIYTNIHKYPWILKNFTNIDITDIQHI